MVLRRALLVLTAAGLWAASVLGADAPPRQAPEFVVHTLAGKDLLLSSYRGKVVALMFVSTDCPHCLDTTRFMNGLQRQYGPKGFQTLAVAFNAMAIMLVEEFAQRANASFPVGYSDRDPVYDFLQRSPKLRTYVPIMVFIDRAGKIRGQYMGDDPFMGPSDAARDNNIRKLVARLVAEPAPPAKK